MEVWRDRLLIFECECTHRVHGLFKEAECGSLIKLEIREQESIFSITDWNKILKRHDINKTNERKTVFYPVLVLNVLEWGV